MATQVTLNSGSVDSAGSLLLKTNGTTTAVTLDTSQNMGLGVTPSAWSGFKALELANGAYFASYTGGGNFTEVGVNNYFDGGSWRYKNTDYAARYVQNVGQHQFYTAASGTAGNAITFTQAMTLDASGNLLVGATSGSGLWSGSEKIIKLKSSSSDAAGVQVSSSNAQNSSIELFASYGASDTGLVTKGDSAYQNLIFGAYSGASYSERARIDSSGNLLVGTTSNSPAGTQSQFVNQWSGGSKWGASFNQTVSSSTSYTHINFSTNGTTVGHIDANNTATSYSTSSDYRLKHDVSPMTGALAKVAALKPVTYKWNTDGSDGEGFIAHELAEVCPHAVVGEKDAVDEDGNPKYQGIDTSFLVATLTAAIQEQQAIIEQLRTDVASLKA